MLLSTIKIKLMAFFAAIGVFMVGYIKYLKAKNARLEHNEEVREEIEEIQDKQKTDRSEALEDEKQTIKKRVEKSNGSRRDRFSKL